MDEKISEMTGTDLQSLEDFTDDGKKQESPLILPDTDVVLTNEGFLGSGNDGVVSDYSEKNAKHSPYDGALGLQLVDTAVQRAKERSRRVIAIGDAHACWMH
jgi:hypothetical protein